MGIQGEPGQDTRWHRQGVSFPNTLLQYTMRGKKKGGGINHRKKANYFFLPYKWNSRANSQEAPSKPLPEHQAVQDLLHPFKKQEQSWDGAVNMEDLHSDFYQPITPSAGTGVTP